MSDSNSITSAEDVELLAYDILSSSDDYNTSANKLAELYANTPDTLKPQAKEIISTYGQDIRHKTKEAAYDYVDLVSAAPVKADEVLGETEVDKINAWEKANIEAIQASDDPDYVVDQKNLLNSIKAFASEARRENLSDRGEGVWAWTVDKGLRATRGAIGPLANLVGLDEVDSALYERTQKSRDEGIAGRIATNVGNIIPAAVAGVVAGPIGLGVVGGAQIAGEATSLYKESIAKTGNQEQAIQAAVLSAAGEAITNIPLLRVTDKLASGILGKFGTKVLQQSEDKTLAAQMIKSLEDQKTTFKNVTIDALEAGTAGAVGEIIGNVAQNIGLDENREITIGAIDAFAANLITGGFISGGTALVKNSVIKQTQNAFKDAEKKLATPDPVESAQETTGANIPKFVKDADGHYVQDFNADDKSTRARAADKAREDSIVADYVEQPVSYNDDIVTNEAGDTVSLPVMDDYETDSRPVKTVLIPEEELASTVAADNVAARGDGTLANDIPRKTPPANRFVTFLANKLAGNLGLSKNILDGALGVYSTGSKKIKILRSLGSDPKKFSETIAHEIGHFIDGYLNKAFSSSNELQGMAEKLTGLKANLINELAKAGVQDLASNLSAEWRPGWDPTQKGDAKSPDAAERFNAYRADSVEIYADTFSALVNAPDWVKERYGPIYSLFEKGLSRDPILNQFWSEFSRAMNDPNAVSQYNIAAAGESRKKGIKINAAYTADEIKYKGFKSTLARIANTAYQTLFNRFDPVRKIINTLPTEARKTLQDIVNNVTRKDMVYHFLNRVIDQPLNALTQKFMQTDIGVNTWAHYEWANKLINETTPTIKRIEDNPDLYRKVALGVKDILSKDKTIKQQILNTYFSDTQLATPEGIINAFANLGLIGDAAQVLSVNDFLNKYAPDDPQRTKKAMTDYNLAVGRLNQARESLPIAKLRKSWADANLGEAADAAFNDVLRRGAFSVRRFLVNAGGSNIYDAKRDLAYIEQSLGAEKYKTLQGISRKFHDILSSGLATIEAAEILSPEMLERFKLNQGSYVTNLVLKYYEGDGNINGSIRQAIGSLNETGDELSASSIKTKAIIERAYVQRAINGAVRVAETSGQAEKLGTNSPGFDVFEQKDRLSRKDKRNSYLIQYTAGVPSLYKLEGKGWERMFDSYQGGAFFGPVMQLADRINNSLLTRALKTVYNPVFIFNQKFMDRKMEAIWARTIAPTIGPWHTNKKLSDFYKKARKEYEHFAKTGELIGELKEVVDLDGVTLGMSVLADKNIDPSFTFEQSIAELYGVPIPNEASFLEKIGINSEKIIDKFGGSYLKDIAERDEVLTKVIGYQIGKHIRGMSKPEAAQFARQRFGVPDPVSGGTASPFLNRLFLFGRAHLNGLRNLAAVTQDSIPNMATQLALRIALPKVVLMPAVMAAAIKAVSGEEAAEKYQIWLDMVPEFEKISKFIVPVGFQDGQGNFRGFLETPIGDIQGDWKAIYGRLPQSRELTAISRVMWPMISNAFNLEPGKAIGQSLKAAGTTSMASLNPLVQYATNLWQLTVGDNPTDFYRMKGILDKDVANSGSYGEKFFDYGKYWAASQAPSLAPYNAFKTEAPVGGAEKVIASVPVIGPGLRGYLGITNYGTMEKDISATKERELLSSKIVLSTSDTTRDVLNQYRKAAGIISKKGKGWEAEVGPDSVRKMRMLTAWNARIWTPYKQELLLALSAQDIERYDYLLEQLDSSSEQIFAQIQGVGDQLEESDKPKK